MCGFQPRTELAQVEDNQKVGAGTGASTFRLVSDDASPGFSAQTANRASAARWKELGASGVVSQPIGWNSVLWP
jgi:hypothetical protein